MKPIEADAKPNLSRRSRLHNCPLSIFARFGIGSANGNKQAGGTTILVVLTLLVLLTVAGLSMSKNSLKEIQTTAFVRQGAMATQVADSGIEWAFYWVDLGDPPESDGAPAKLIALKNALARDNSRSGTMWDITSAPNSNSYVKYEPGKGLRQEDLPPPSMAPGFNEGSEPDFKLSYTIGLTRMGKLPIANMSQGGAYNPASGGANLQAPDLWAIRSDAQVKPVGSSVTFTQAREMWVSTPVR
jgi:hypothetical protein